MNGEEIWIGSDAKLFGGLSKERLRKIHGVIAGSADEKPPLGAAFFDGAIMQDLLFLMSASHAAAKAPE